MTEATPVRRVAVQGDDRVAADLAGTALSVGDVADADALVTVGEEAFLEAARTEVGVPLLPVGVGEGHHAVTRRDVAAAAAALADGAFRRVDHDLLGVSVGDGRVRHAVMDATLMTVEPARISEYAVHVGDEELDAVRADGVVVASAVGSSGYARAAGGPVLTPGTGLAVVPVAPFATRADDWVTTRPVTLTVERDEGAVALYVDREEVGVVAPGDPVTVEPTGSFTALRVLDAGE